MNNASRTGRARAPRFFWQGVLIVLPVMVLAVVSLLSLRSDEQAAEREARKKAGESVQGLARAMRVIVNDDLNGFGVMEGIWEAELLSRSPGDEKIVTHDADLAKEMSQWETNYPGINLDEIAIPLAEIQSDGRLLLPPEIPSAPVAPEWFLELSPQQADLWRALREAVASKDTNLIQQTSRAFLGSGISQPTWRIFTALTSPPEENLRIDDGLMTETGVSFQDVAAFQILKSEGPLSNNVLQAIWQRLFQSPTFIAPNLLELLRTQTNRFDAKDREMIGRMSELWKGQSRGREFLASLHLPPDSALPPAPVWVKSESGEEALLFFESHTNGFQGVDVKGHQFNGQEYGVSFVPRAIVEAIFRRAFQENNFLVPAYVTPVVTVQGEEMQLAGRTKLSSTNSSLPEIVFGAAVQTIEPILEGAGAGNFEVKFYLADPQQMLAAERRRTKLFGALILGTALTALVGLVAAWRAFKRQRELSEMKSNFVSSVSHELRAPIASVRLMAESLEHGKVTETPKQKEYYGFIVQECRRLTSLIENVLDFARIEQGRKQFEFEPTNVVELVIQTVRVMEMVAVEKGVRLVLDTLPDQSVELNVDGKAIQQALVNLIDNAVKHSVKGGIVKVGIEAPSTNIQAPEKHQASSSNANSVRVFVEDNGAGIAEGEQEKIFERFYRSGSEMRRVTQGVGIGLSIVKHIVEAHGGRVRVESEVGRGSKFTIELPMRKLNE